MSDSEEFEFDLEGFDADLAATLRQSREAFRGAYKDQLNVLSGFSRAEIDAITPGTEDLETYDQLIAVVKEASRKNQSQQALKSQIEKLGAVALEIAKRVPNLVG